MSCRFSWPISPCFTLIFALAAAAWPAQGRTIKAHVVALDQPLIYNRLGSSQANGMIFALARDVVPLKGHGHTDMTCAQQECQAGFVSLRPAKRPRPLVLRVNAGDDLEITFKNLLLRTPANPSTISASTFTRRAGVHIVGVEWDSVTLDDGTFVGDNETSYATPDNKRIYKVHAPAEGAYLLTSTAGPLAQA